ncbi:cache domain-containing sensor histidine kinase [Paenibacillus agricola]|uniref:histidine kinase n=1 Tax=Paenibacillus agricola TaxID=2716264 RepID=A0ABX0JHB0_9BACL|nr:sensor histidine kinase [Paenibacillus agricola]NHN33714.1 sensor histidine kinase [Paenibacillus agricola]
MMKSWNKLSLLYKLILVYLVLIVVPTLVISYVGYKSHRDTMEDNVNRFALETLQQLALNVDSYLINLMQLSVFPYYDNQLTGYWKSPSTNKEAALQMSQAALKFSDNTVFSNRNDINGVIFFDGSIDVLSFLRNNYIDSTYNYKQADWYKESLAEAGRPILVGGQSSNFDKGEERIITVSRLINDLDSYKPIGVFVIHANLSMVKEVVDKMSPLYQGKVYIFDQKNRPLYGEFTETGMEQALVEMLKNNNYAKATQYMKLDKTEFTTHLVASDRTGVKALYVIPVEDLVKNQKLILYSTTSLALVSVLASILIFFVIARQLTTPLKELQRLMRKVEMGNFQVRFNSSREDEIGRLGSGFNYMVTEMRQMIHDVYDANLRKKDAELTALRNQINPHFLYNTLESINMVAELKGVYEISDMIGELGELLRLSLRRGTHSTVEEEMRLVQIYMSIQQIRSEGKFTGQFEFDEEVLPLKTLKMILQPIIENAIDHGLGNKDAVGTILIQAKREGSFLRFYIIDNGMGISNVRMEQIHDRFKQEGYEDKSIGLKNVHERILLNYGIQYGIRICSMEGEGTTVQLTLPLRI